VRSHDLNRLLDEPGPDQSRLFTHWKYLFLRHLILRTWGHPTAHQSR